jgi:hypothetical protein
MVECCLTRDRVQLTWFFGYTLPYPTEAWEGGAEGLSGLEQRQMQPIEDDGDFVGAVVSDCQQCSG